MKAAKDMSAALGAFLMTFRTSVSYPAVWGDVKH